MRHRTSPFVSLVVVLGVSASVVLNAGGVAEAAAQNGTPPPLVDGAVAMAALPAVVTSVAAGGAAPEQGAPASDAGQDPLAKTHRRPWQAAQSLMSRGCAPSSAARRRTRMERSREPSRKPQ